MPLVILESNPDSPLPPAGDLPDRTGQSEMFTARKPPGFHANMEGENRP
jgi:hypothetical protein